MDDLKASGGGAPADLKNTFLDAPNSRVMLSKPSFNHEQYKPPYQSSHSSSVSQSSGGVRVKAKCVENLDSQRKHAK